MTTSEATLIEYRERTGTWTTPRGNGVSITYREGTSDWNTISSCLTHDEYGLRDLHVSGLALDIGAHVGAVTLALLADNADLRVIALEPVPDNVDLLKRNVDANGFADRCEVTFGAAGSKPGRTIIHYRYHGNESAEHHAFIGNTALHQGAGPMTCPSDVPHEHVEVPVYSLAQLAPDGAAFVKIDCEGGEWGFLRGKLPVSELRGEWHPTDGHTQADFRALLSDFALTFSGPDAGPQGFRAVMA